jgi:hypothetical protein
MEAISCDHGNYAPDSSPFYLKLDHVIESVLNKVKNTSHFVIKKLKNHQAPRVASKKAAG